VSRPFIVRSIALLLVLVGLQAGAFRDLDTGHEWYFGAEDSSAAIMSEARKVDPAIDGLPGADAPPAPPAALDAGRALRFTLYTTRASTARTFRPDPTGPPRA